jgi:hypothetical protein
MNRLTWCASVLLGLLALVGTAAIAAPVELRGQTPGGARYLIVVPEGWQPGGPLVFVNHGFNFALDLDPDVGPLRDVQLAQGYALAASGFRGRGWALSFALDDNAELLDVFRREVGPPGQIIPMGGSMGGIISLKQAEDPRFANVAGVYAACPAAAGARTWDGALDLRLVYDVVCEGVGGGELPDGAAPMPWAYDLDQIPLDLADPFDNDAVLRALARVTQCTGLALSPALRTPPQRDRLERLKTLSGIRSEDFLAVNLAYATFALGDLVRAPDKLGNRNPFDTRGVDYGDAEVNAKVPRFAPDPFAQWDLIRSSTLDGHGSHRILSLHTGGDELLPPQHQQALSNLYRPERLVQAIATESERSHCGFSDAEGRAGWEALRAWIGGSPQPTAASLQANCGALVANGSEDGPCRLVAHDASDTSALDAVIAPRPALAKSLASARIEGSWYDPTRDGEGLYLEPQPDGTVVVTWYTFPAEGGGGEQLWLVGAGRVQGNGLAVDLLQVSGGRFGSQFDPADVQRRAWGRVTLVFDGDASATLRYEGPAAYGSGTRTLTRLSQQRRPLVEFSAPPPGSIGVDLAGAFFDPARSGDGVFLHTVTDAEGARRVPILFWYTFDDSGRPIWLIGAESSNELALPPFGYMSFDLVQPVGTRFGPGFDPSAVQRRAWGSVTLAFAPGTCNAVRLEWRRRADGATGTLDYTRLTRPNASRCPNS